MKRLHPKPKKKTKPKKTQTASIRALRGKYKHLDLMGGLLETRREERKPVRPKPKKKQTSHRGRSKRRAIVQETPPVYGTVHQRDLFETGTRNGQRLGYSPAYAEPAFTNFRTVEPATDLSKLNLNWREADLPEKERTKHVHRLHPYLGKFIPQLVEAKGFAD